ncbi:MAG: cytochrome c biogenesis protein CcsA [Pirellulaceae bacterium]
MSPVRAALQAMASLKLTVVLFALAVILIFAGTLAQAELNMWEVMSQYFRGPIAWIDLNVFFPEAFFPGLPTVPGTIPFPGGLTIGVLMAVNLLAAHTVRFKVQARGTQLWIGVAVIALGVCVTYLVVAAGSNPDGFQGEPIVPYATIWQLFRFSAGAIVTLGLVGWLLAKRPSLSIPAQRATWTLVGMSTVASAALMVWGANSPFGDSSMRILWQLLQGTFAGVVLLIGCYFVFHKRAGIVLTHGGIMLMMFSELLVGQTAVEEMITFEEGQSVRFARDMRELELAIVDRSDSASDHVIAVPMSRLLREEELSAENLPFDLQLIDFYKNSTLVPATGSSKANPATAGSGLEQVAEELSAATGASSDGQDVASAYIRIHPKAGSEKDSVHLFSQWLGDGELLMPGVHRSVPERVVVGDREYEVSLRFKRTYKDYSLTLLDVEATNYLGTQMAKSYESHVKLDDPERGIVRDRKIWMNNPLRYAGETFYQSSYGVLPSGKEFSALQVVTNQGWMIPYVACMLVSVGLFAHFMQVLVRFLNRKLAPDSSSTSVAGHEEAVSGGSKRRRRGRRDAALPKDEPGVGWTGWVFPLAMLLLMVIWLGGKVRPKPEMKEGMDLAAFGRLPVVHEGRTKPMDSLARVSLRILSNRDYYVDPPKDEGETKKLFAGRPKKHPAIEWLLDTISQAKGYASHRVIKIDNREVQELFGLKPRFGGRYSLAELSPKIGEFEAEIQKLPREADRSYAFGKMDTFQLKLVELDRRLRYLLVLQRAFQPYPFETMTPQGDTDEELQASRMELASRLMQEIREIPSLHRSLMQAQPPLVVPERGEGDQLEWLPYAISVDRATVDRMVGGDGLDPLVVSWVSMLHSYDQGDASDFNKEVESYRKLVAERTASSVNLPKVQFESRFNLWQPFYLALVLYLASFVATLLGWLRWESFRRTALLWILLAFVVHLLAVGARVYISGRPPVTTLYSSAVFIGCGAVLAGLVLELVFGLGIGNALAGLSGFLTLLIAHYLSVDGDTFTVLVAVLDTQFWLSTHVVTVTLGYAATFVAGLLAVMYILASTVRPDLPAEIRKVFYQATYGIVCFAIFFSFVGTVLGGLWADDSWGRFWGWDPKENGALMIVLWNALILHARWGGLVRERGFAVLCVIGNIVTGWSWFGVNELGVGKHSYGFTEGVMMWLLIFVISQMAVSALGIIQSWLHRVPKSEVARQIAPVA